MKRRRKMLERPKAVPGEDIYGLKIKTLALGFYEIIYKLSALRSDLPGVHIFISYRTPSGI